MLLLKFNHPTVKFHDQFYAQQHVQPYVQIKNYFKQPFYQYGAFGYKKMKKNYTSTSFICYRFK